MNIDAEPETPASGFDLLVERTAEEVRVARIRARAEAKARREAESKPMSERAALWRMFFVGLVLLAICVAGFILSGFGVLWLFGSAACLMFCFFAIMLAVMA